ncbi:MAG: hypothetical protein KGJ13_07805 [Patescibacteria group bacterium]|nr:hypothetical protein [Patescibacteria group bacterium]
MTYTDMAERHGHDQAYDLLKGMERLAEVKNKIVPFDREVRFRRAVEALCETATLHNGRDGKWK